MKANFGFIIALLSSICIFSEATAQRRISVNNAVSCPTGTPAIEQCVAENRVGFFIHPDSLPRLDKLTDPNRVPRFEAFWLPGDGNYVEFTNNDVTSDAASLNPPDYSYPPNSSSYTATTYLTGKYTNTTPPPQYSRTVNLGQRGREPEFNRLLATDQRMDIHSNHFGVQDPTTNQTGHLIRGDNLTAFVVSYANNLSGKLYFFYNGRKDPSLTPPNHIAACPPASNVLQYQSNDTPKYFEGVTTAEYHPASDLALPVFGGTNYTAQFESLHRKYKDVIMYSNETVTPSVMPIGFSEKRQFPIFKGAQASTLQLPDAVLSVLVILTGPQPLSDDDPAAQQISDVLNAYGLGLSPFSSITVTDTSGTQEYIIGAFEATVYYVTGFDPNQLVVENITPENELYRVTFRLDICNEGQAPVGHQNVSIRYPDGAFWDIQYKGDKADGTGNDVGYVFSSNGHGLWKFDLEMPLNEVPPPSPGEEHQESCGSVYFTVLTDCKGVRSLWRENVGKVLEACIVFPETLGKEAHCGYNYPIESDQFKEANGDCLCCIEKPCPTSTYCNWQYCLLLLLGLILFLLWLLKKKYLPWLSNLIS